MRTDPKRLALAGLLLCALSTPGCRLIGLGQGPVDVKRPAGTTETGLRFKELFLGTGPAAEAGDTVTFDYTLWLADGTRVDSTIDRGIPVTVRLGEAPIAGWNEGLLGVRKQGRRKLFVPPELAYGAEGVPGLIPPDAELVFEIQVAKVGDR